MGCISSKGASASEYVQNHHGRGKETRSSKRFVVSSKKDEPVVENDGSVNDVTTRLISGAPLEDNAVSTSVGWEDELKDGGISENRVRSQIQRHSTRDNSGNGEAEVAQTKSSRIVSMPNGAQVAHIAAGWPSWLTAVAGEAISGWVPRRADTFEKLEKIGQGPYSSVYRAKDLETGKFVAMKKVRFVNMGPESVRFMAREINILRKLDHPNVMKLECLVTSRVSGSLYLVFEYMEHDLAGLAARPGVKFTESQDYRFAHPEVTILDPPNAIQHLRNRQSMLQDVADLNFTNSHGFGKMPGYEHIFTDFLLNLTESKHKEAPTLVM